MTPDEAQVSAVHGPGTELAPYAERPLEQYQPGLAMSPQQAKALDDQVRACTRAVLREGTDYGVIPGTGDTRKVLLKPGAEKLLQWFGFGFDCRCLEVERDDKGSKQGVTYRCTITKRIGDPLHGLLVDVATCEGYAGYDEPKFWQSAEEAQRKAEAKERMWAKKDRRVASPEKWKHLGEYRAPWNTVIKMAQKRAIVGATIDATAAAGLFSADEPPDTTPVPADGAPSWYEQALETALTFTDKGNGQELWRETAAAAREGLCTPAQATHVQNRIVQRIKLLQRATPLDLDDADGEEHGEVFGAEVADDHTNGEEGHQAPVTAARIGGGPPPADVSAAVSPGGGDGPAAPPTAPGEPGGRDPAGGGAEKQRSDPAASPADQVQQRRINALFRQMEWTDRDDRLRATSALAGREITTLADLTAAEASPLIETLARISRQPDPAIALTTAVAQARSSRAPGEEPAGG